MAVDLNRGGDNEVLPRDGSHKVGARSAVARSIKQCAGGAGDSVGRGADHRDLVEVVDIQPLGQMECDRLRGGVVHRLRHLRGNATE